MGNERKLRLIQVAKEFKVGLNTITDFLQKKGIKSDGSPNTLVDAETYAVLEKEFGANRAAGGKRGGHQKQRNQRQGRNPAAEVPRQDRPVAQTQGCAGTRPEGGSGKTRRTASCGPRSTGTCPGAQGCRTTRTGHACNPGSPAVTGSPCHTGKPRRTRNASACGACCSGCPGCAR